MSDSFEAFLLALVVEGLWVWPVATYLQTGNLARAALAMGIEILACALLLVVCIKIARAWSQRGTMKYIAYLHKDNLSDYGVSFPDFPGCITAGSSLEEARSLAAQALALHVAGMREDSKTIPKPSTLDDLRGDPAMKDAVMFLTDLRD